MRGSRLTCCICRLRLYFSIILFYTIHASAQEAHPHDSGWIEKFSDKIIIKCAFINTSETLVTETDGFNDVLKPNPSEVIRTYINYRFISFYVNYIPHFLPGNNDNLEKGRTKGIGFGTDLNFRNWFTEVYFSHTKGYYLENTKDFRPDWQPGDPYFQIPDLHVISLDGSVGYNTNPHLSLPATTSQTERQLKSAGAFIPKISYRYSIIDNRTVSIYSTQKSYNFQGLLGAGYQHTFVIRKLFYALGGFTPSFGYIYSKVLTRPDSVYDSFTNRGPIYQWNAKLGLGYNSHRIFSGVYLTATSSKYSQGLTTAVNQDATIFFQLFLGIRLATPKIIRKKIDNIF
jgi:hypothetical protein